MTGKQLLEWLQEQPDEHLDRELVVTVEIKGKLFRLKVTNLLNRGKVFLEAER